MNDGVSVQAHLTNKRNGQRNEVMQLSMSKAMILVPPKNNNETEKQIH